MNNINLDGLDFSKCNEICINGEVYCKKYPVDNALFHEKLTNFVKHISNECWTAGTPLQIAETLAWIITTANKLLNEAIAK